MHKKHTIHFFKFSSILVILAILLNFSPVFGQSENPLPKTKNRINIGDIQNKINDFKSLFLLNPDRETTGILFYGKIKNGRFEVGTKGEMIYDIRNQNRQYHITETFVNGTPAPFGIDETNMPFNNLIGNNQVTKNLTYYKQIGVGEVYEGINVTLNPAEKSIEKIITLNPKADPSQIRINLHGHEKLSVNPAGELLLENNTKNPSVKFSKPVAYQNINNSRQEVDVKYEIYDENTYGFYLGQYDSSYELIIDPILYSTFIGGENTEEYTSEMNAAEEIMVIAEDPADNQQYVYVTGYTNTNGDFPAPFLPEADSSARGPSDIFLVKLPLDLSEISAAALLGGNGSDIYSSITADTGGNIYLTFKTTSTDIPTTASSYQQTFGGGSYDISVMKLPPSLNSITAATYLGGNKTDDPGNLAVNNGYVYITGTTSNSGGGNTFPVGPTSGADEVYNHTAGSTGYEVFISRLNDQLSNTYYAGTLIQTDMGNPALTVHSTDSNPDNDKLFITGRTDSELEIIDQINAYQPTYGGGINDNFIARFNSKLTTLEKSTFLGGTSYSNGAGSIDIYDAGGGTYRVITANDTIDGNAFFSILRTDGSNARHDYDANSNNSVINNCDADDLYVANFDYDLTEASVALICGDDSDYHPRATQDSSGNIYVTASTGSSNFPVNPDSYEQHVPGHTDVVIIKLSNDLSSLLSSTYLGGADSTEFYSKGIRFDATDKLYVSGQTFSTDFPTTPDTVRPYKTTNDSDYFVTVFSNDLTSPCSPMYNNEDTDGAGPISAVSEMCVGLRINPAPAYFENVPSSFNFPAKYATSIAQSSFNNTTVGSDDILTVKDLSGTGGFDVTIQASDLTNGYETIDLSNLYLVTTAPGSANLNTLDSNLNGTTSAEQITYAEGSLGQNLVAPQKTTGDIAYPATYLTNGKNFASDPITLISAASAGHYLRASTALSFYLNIPSNTTPGTYSTLFTIDLIQN